MHAFLGLCVVCVASPSLHLRVTVSFISSERNIFERNQRFASMALEREATAKLRVLKVHSVAFANGEFLIAEIARHTDRPIF